MSRIRIIIGLIVFGIAVPLMLFRLLDLHSASELFTIAAVTFLAWGLSDLLSKILERPRLEDRTPGRAIREDLERRANDQ
ncbi:MAG TPA: hypothetical protein VF701_18480 [Thermoanaerobaculia bacterium]